uniref:phospholipase C n=1 Tax=Solibacter usitatus (strain Ellin6076) TaxID=234267 RepID=Q01T59_SOLUE
MSPFTRRQFFIDAARLSGSAGLAALLGPVARASAIEAEPGSTYLDADHVVILMQENRSFDHAFGTLRGVRGFNDPRAVTLPDGNPVWLQTNAAGETYAPFRLNIKDTNATWLGSLPHSWRDQTDARNHGNHDRWLDAKPSGRKECAGMPLTLGYYDREDLPFYYALADAFTICDQNFCSSLTGTTPNRLYLWTGTIREQQNAESPANVRNSDVDYGSTARWPTFPERLEDAGVSWKIYQNEISLLSGLAGERDAWLSNFTDNPIEWFEQFNVGFSKTFRAYAQKAVATLPEEIAELDRRAAAATGADAAKLRREKQSLEKQLQLIRGMAPKYTDDAWSKLTQRERNLHEKAFCTNAADPDYRDLTTLRYRDGAIERELKVPKGDVLHQFRADVAQGKLPAVSWIVPPENFSDHPGAPWYGAWMVSEVLNILTHNPEVWKKTIFILAYDENDGYFDHVVPFGAPDPARRDAGKTSEGIDPAVEFWSLARDRERRSTAEARGSSIGLGFRVPLLVASPWSRGGFVCSQVFDHTSVLQLLEKLLSRKTGKAIHETNISAWRRTVCGDLSSVFLPATSGPDKLTFPERDAVIEAIHKARFKKAPSGYRKLAASEIADFRRDPQAARWMPRQEKGVRPSLAIPYELYAEGRLSANGKLLEISMEAGTALFGARSAGSPFHAYAPGKFRGSAELRTRAYAVEPGKRVQDAWEIEVFENGVYHLSVCGPNGFLREFAGGPGDPEFDIRCKYTRGGDLTVVLINRHAKSSYAVELADHMYQGISRQQTVAPGQEKSLHLALAKSFSWYDFTIRVNGAETYLRRCAGRVETGKTGYSDPVMARLV